MKNRKSTKFLKSITSFLSYAYVDLNYWYYCASELQI